MLCNAGRASRCRSHAKLQRLHADVRSSAIRRALVVIDEGKSGSDACVAKEMRSIVMDCDAGEVRSFLPLGPQVRGEAITCIETVVD